MRTMRTSLTIMLLLICIASIKAYNVVPDSTVSLNDVVVIDTYKTKSMLKPVPLVIADKNYMQRHLSGVWVNTLGNLPGVRAMGIGNGFGKAMIRGLGFNRIAYIEGDIKQESQQWGADHGLEVDAFEDNKVEVIKGPSSLLYGSDALGGAIISSLPLVPINQGLHGDFTLLTSTLNGSIGGSLLATYTSKNSFFRLRYSEQHYADRKINTDSITYLSIKIPIASHRMKNTAGYNRALKTTYAYQQGQYRSFYQISNVYEKVGFFPGAHGIPDLRRLTDDGKAYNIELPYSNVNHIKLYTKQSYTFNSGIFASISGCYQQNFRQEWSLFHTHYSTQPIPKKDPNKELQLKLHTITLRGEATYAAHTNLNLKTVGDISYRKQTIAGYGFLIPPYQQINGGIGLVADYTINDQLKLESGIRYDAGHIKAKSCYDPYLEAYLKEYNFPQQTIQEYNERSKRINRNFGSFSGSVGSSYQLNTSNSVTASAGIGFRFPGINELASNGVHHGSFRHDRGDANLNPERALQINLGYNYNSTRIKISLSSFYNYFWNYIYGTPTGLWSVLPHSGQIYQYKQNKALLMGGEAIFQWQILPWLNYDASLEYVYTYNIDRDTPLPFSPPLRATQGITIKSDHLEYNLSHKIIGTANRIVPGEEITKGANLFDSYLSWHTQLSKGSNVSIAFNASNILNTKYYNHLSYYRKIGVPEEGRNYNLNIKITF